MQLIDETVKEVDESTVKTLVPLTINIEYADGTMSGHVITFVDNNMSASMALKKKIKKCHFLTVINPKAGQNIKTGPNTVILCNTNQVQNITILNDK